MKKEEAEKYIAHFPALTVKAKREAELTLNPYIIYDRKRKIGRCTYCGKILNLKRNTLVNHTRMTCTECKYECELIDSLSGYHGYNVECRSNVIVYLNKRGSEDLYIRCFTLEMFFGRGKFKTELKPEIEYTECRRYVFTADGCAEYLPKYSYKQDKYVWCVATRVRAPYFANCCWWINEINSSAIEKTWYKYSALREWHSERKNGYRNYSSSIDYLKFYRRHTGAERLVKCGLRTVVDDCMRGRDNCSKIDWKQTEVPKMLHLNQAEFDFVRNDPYTRYFDYLRAREAFSTISDPAKRFKYYIATQTINIKAIAKRAGTTTLRLAKYITKNTTVAVDYQDYFNNCLRLKYDVKQPSIAFPRDFYAAHDRAADAVIALENHIEQERLDELKKRREMLCKEFGEYVIIQPDSVADIIREGRIQNHCVGGYAKRHCDGKLTIMFLRKKDDLQKPYYTMEISNDLEIVQCRGYQNNRYDPKPPEVEEIERKYAEYLKSILPKWKKASQNPLKAVKKQERIGA